MNERQAPRISLEAVLRILDDIELDVREEHAARGKDEAIEVNENIQAERKDQHRSQTEARS